MSVPVPIHLASAFMYIESAFDGRILPCFWCGTLLRFLFLVVDATLSSWNLSNVGELVCSSDAGCASELRLSLRLPDPSPTPAEAVHLVTRYCSSVSIARAVFVGVVIGFVAAWCFLQVLFHTINCIAGALPVGVVPGSARFYTREETHIVWSSATSTACT